MLHLAFVVTFYLASGTFISMGFLKQAEIGRRYYLVLGLGVSILSGLSFYYLGRYRLDPDSQIWLSIFISASALYSVAAGYWRWIARLLYFIGAISALAVIIRDVEQTFHYRMLGDAPIAYLVANALLSSCLLGCTMAALLLGHWYLIQPKLSRAELARLIFIFSALVVLRFGFGGYFLYHALNGKSEFEVYRYLFSTTPGIFVLLRWTWGLVGPLLLTVIILSTVKRETTRAATGILYLAIVLVLTGEIISQYLALFHAIPL